MRDFGIDPNIIDNLNTESFKQRLKNDIITQIEKYEPRAKVNSINISIDTDGLTVIKLKLRILEGSYETAFKLQ